jgi:hypothetical protein
MVPTPKIVTHYCIECPVPGHAWIASFYVDAYAGTKKDGDRRVVGLSRLPMSFFGASEEDAIGRATLWWGKEQEREASREAAVRARVEGARKARNAA